MIRFHKSFFDPYYKESFYKDFKNKTLGSAIAHLFVAAVLAAFIVSILFYSLQKNRVENFILSTLDTISNEYPYSYKIIISKEGVLESNINPVALFKTSATGKKNVTLPNRLIAIDSTGSIKNPDYQKYNAHFVFLKDGYIKVTTGEVNNYHGYEGLSMSRSKVDIFLQKARTLAPFIPRFISFLLFLGIFLVYPLFYMAQSLCIGVVLYVVFNYWFKEKILYKEAYILSIFAGGTVLFISVLFFMLGLPLFAFFTSITSILFVVMMHRNADYFPVKIKKIKNIKKLIVKKKKVV